MLFYYPHYVDEEIRESRKNRTDDFFFNKNVY